MYVEGLNSLYHSKLVLLFIRITFW
jgi:hypothetical protein